MIIYQINGVGGSFRVPIQLLRIMKLTILIMTLFLVQVSALTKAQITLNEKHASLQKVLKSISKQSGYDLICQAEDLKNANPVTVKLNNASVETALSAVFSGQPLIYQVSEKTVMVKRKEEVSFIENIIARFQSIDVKGRVVDEKGQALVGATIAVKGKKQATKTVSDGNFALNDVEEKDVILVSFIGYKALEIAVRADVGVVTLRLEDNSLEQVQVIAYGEVQKKFSTSNLTSISGNVIKDQPVSNPLIALQGRIPGIMIRQQNGLNTGSLDVLVQGKNSIGNGNDPFYVIDGIPLTPNSLMKDGLIFGSIGSGLGINNLNFINPSEIESITVLKDADATAIYGSRAANGAILITTKKGKIGKTKVDFSTQAGWGKLANTIKMLNTEQYIAFKKEAFSNNNQIVPASAADINGTWDPNRNIDWQKEILGGTAQFQNIQATLSGGNENTQFLAGTGYIRETPIFKGNFSNKKNSVNFNINHRSNDHKFKFFLSASYLSANNKLPMEDVTIDAVQRLAPNFPNLYNSDGTINWAPVPNIRPFQSTTEQPAAKLTTLYTNESSNLLANSNLSYEIIPGLVIKSSFGFNSLQSNEKGISPTSSIPPEDVFYGGKPSARFSDKSIKSWIIEPQASYIQRFSFGTIDALIGSTFQKTENYLLSLAGEQYNSDQQLTDLNSAGVKSTIGSLQSIYNYAGVFGRLNYRVKDRYILNVAIRRDGSSRFGSENRFHSFYSFGGAWMFSEEYFIKRAFPFIDFGKIRASFGTTGNDQIGDYSFYSLYNTNSVPVPYLGVVALSPNNLSNPYLQWEETKKLNLGLDLGFFSNRLQLSANYYRNRSSNQLLGENLSLVTGFGSITRNLPALVQNKGWEISLDATIVKAKKFKWQTTFNATLPENKLIRYDGLENTSDKSRFSINKSINLIRLYPFAGVNSETGLYQIVNSNGELTSKPNELTDKTVEITRDVKWQAGYGNTFTYKRLSLDVFFIIVNQYAPNLKYVLYPSSQFNRNYLIDVLDHWKKPGDIVTYQRISSNPNQINDAWYGARDGDGSFNRITYARLNNATLSYDFNTPILSRMHIVSARMFIQGQNLFSISNYKNGDPEVQSLSNLGLIRMLSIGAQFSF